MRDDCKQAVPTRFELLEGRRLLTSDGQWLGINAGDIAQATLTSDLSTTGIHVVRDGFNAAPNSTFTTKVNNYVAAGVDAHVSINYRGNGIDVADYPTWLANYKQRCIDIMTAYKGKLDYYIVGNEPDKSDPYTGNLTAQQAVDFTRMAYEASRQVDPTGGIKIESAPVSSNSPANNYLQNMFADGVTNYCDYVGMHIYSSQINDGRLNLPWTYEAAAGGTQKPFAVSEMGVSTAWAPSGYTAAQQQQWMADFLDQAYVQLKRYGIGNTILFESSSSSGTPSTYNLLRDGTTSRNILTTTYNEIQNNLSQSPLQDGGFESANDYKRQWVVYDDPSDGTWSTTGYNFQASGGHSGSYAMQMDTSGSGNRIVRQVIGGVTVGQPVTLSAWVYSTNPNGGTIKAEGYNAIDGDAETASTTQTIGGWKQLSVTVTPTNPWVVLELSTVSNGKAGSYVKFDDVAVTAKGLPASFVDRDIGSPAKAGSAGFDGSTFTVAGGGADIWNASDQFNFASETFSGSGTIIARVASQTNSNAHAEAGVMFRDSTAANAAFADVVVTPSSGLLFQYRTANGGTAANGGTVYSQTAPAWVKLVRTGNSFSGYYSTDGVSWTQVGATTTVTMASSAQAGLAVLSHNTAATSTATFDHLNLLSNPLPQTMSDLDIGSPAPAGSASYDGTTYTVNGGGSDIGAASDQFNYLNQSWAGDGTMIARFGGMTSPNNSAKAGLMFRDGTAANAAYVYLQMSPLGTLSLQTRTSAGATMLTKATATGLTGPLWLKLSRIGNAFSAYYSSDGSTWTQLGTAQTVIMSSSVNAGMAVTAHTSSLLCSATFDSYLLS